jgi:hypothetical protein
MDKLVLYQDDHKPSLWFQICDENGYIDLSADTTLIYMKVRVKGSTTTSFTLNGTKVKSGGATGWVQFDWGTNLVALAECSYEAEIYVSFDASIQTVGRYWWYGDSSNYANTFPIKVKEDFA